MKYAQVGVHKTIICTKKIGKRKQDRENACIDNEMWHQKL